MKFLILVLLFVFSVQAENQSNINEKLSKFKYYAKKTSDCIIDTLTYHFTIGLLLNSNIDEVIKFGSCILG
jgi:hypothetical protein